MKRSTISTTQNPWLKKALLGASLLVLAACAQPQNEGSAISGDQSTSEILGGTAVQAKDPIAASTVGILIISSRQNRETGEIRDSLSQCTGTLIASDLVLTAAHCAFGAKAMFVTFSLQNPFDLVVDGRAFLQNPVSAAPKNSIQVSKFVVNNRYVQYLKSKPGFGTKDTGDIAILRLSRVAPAGYVPARLMTEKTGLQNGQKVVLAGIGLVKFDQQNDENSVDAVSMNRVTVTLTDANYSQTEVYFDQSNGKGACHGDSGGPAFASVNGKTVMFGVTSRSSADTLEKVATDDCKNGSIYTNIAAWSSWVAQTAKALRQ